ncbi:MAG: iron-sulfur cluster assembly accessory protein [Parvularculales bacterium]
MTTELTKTSTKPARPAVLTLTAAATERLKEIISESPNAGVRGVRIGVENAGCAGMAYTMEYVEEPQPLDEQVEVNGVTVFIEAKALMFLLGTEMDYKVSRLSSGFVFNNPNQVDECGCGESVTLQPAQSALPVSET